MQEGSRGSESEREGGRGLRSDDFADGGGTQGPPAAGMGKKEILPWSLEEEGMPAH